MRGTAFACLFLSFYSALCAPVLPNVVVLSTGGTIASKHNPAKGGYEPALSGEDLVNAIPEIRKLAQVEVEQISNISSSDMTPAIWLQLGKRVQTILQRSDVVGVLSPMGRTLLRRQPTFST